MKCRTYLCLLTVGIFTLTGCGAAQLAIGVAQIGASLGGLPSAGKKSAAHAIYKPNVDTKEIILSELGKPKYEVNLGDEQEVIAYESSNRALLYAFALKNGFYQNQQMFIAKAWKKDEINGKLQAELIRYFPCYAQLVSAQKEEPETATYKTPPTPTSIPRIPISSFAPAVTPASY